ncbi:MAG: hypothetical protein ACRDE7_01095 [Sphingobacterium sp.]
MKIIDYTSFTELGEEILEVQYEDETWQRVSWLWDFWLHLSKIRAITVDYNTFVTLDQWKNLVTIQEITTFVESLKDSKNTII